MSISFKNGEIEEKKHDMLLNLSLSGGQKSGNIFVADQTPTPTRLIEKCDEVGLFEDLRHVNPFEETFRRAVEEQKGGQTPTCGGGGNGNGCIDAVAAEAHTAEESESLHTPQVFPQLELPNSAEVLFRSCGASKRFESPPTCGAVPLDETVLPITDVAADMLTETYKLPTTAVRQNSGGSTAATCLGYGKIAQKYRNIAEKPQSSAAATFMQLSNTATIQLIQPQLITLSFPGSGPEVVATDHKPASAAIPVQTVKPFILPKLSAPQGAKLTPTEANTSAISGTSSNQPTIKYPQTTITHEPSPSSASLTPTSQLPIKERLKAILNHSSKSRLIEEAVPTVPTAKGSCEKTPSIRSPVVVSHHHKYDGDCMQRKRAAATRYRHKMRNEQKELRRLNVELQAENAKLSERVRQLERQLERGYGGVGSTAQIQIPSSTLHLVMNIPQLLVPPHGQPVLQTPITYRVEKK